MCRLYISTGPFYVRDLSVRGLWCPPGSPGTSPLRLLRDQDYEGFLKNFSSLFGSPRKRCACLKIMSYHQKYNCEAIWIVH